MTLNTLIRGIKDLHKSNIGSDLYIIDRLKLQRDKLLSYIQDLDFEVFDILGNSERKIMANIKYIYENAIWCIEVYFHGRFDESRKIIFNTLK